ncbi:hypothetical protein [Streptomyces sp. enrichment culture]|uniref:hypothetical protein n=1 Tax=Streptomyces sp. enrichment culture TaxID=1795815 RepID=UPI003F573A1D
MPIRLIAPSVESVHHIIMPYYTGRPGPGNSNPPRELLIIHTGQLVFTYPETGFAGGLASEQVVSFVPYTGGRVQDYTNFRKSQLTAVASVGAVRSAGDDSDHFMVSTEEVSVTPLQQPGLAGDPWALVLKVNVHVKRGNIYRIPYQVTARIADVEPGGLSSQIPVSLLNEIETGASWFDPTTNPPEG